MKPRININLLLLMLTVLTAGFALGRYADIKQEYSWLVINSLGQLNYLSKIENHLANGNQKAAKEIIDGELSAQLAILSDPDALNVLNKEQKDFVESEMRTRKYNPLNPVQLNKAEKLGSE